jgi:hypothetical protein
MKFLGERLRQGKPWHLLIGVFFVAAGAVITMAAVWIAFDFWAWGWWHPWQQDPNWRFCYPVYVRCVSATNASEILDVALIGGVILAWFLALFGAYIIVTVYENLR